jgi:hypothetical protein
MTLQMNPPKILFILENAQLFRDLFRSDMLQGLIKDKIEVVICANYDPETIKKEFSHPLLRVYPLRFVRPALINRILAPLIKDLYALEHPEATFAQKRALIKNSCANYLSFRYFCARLLRFLGFSSSQLIRWGEHFGSDPEFASVLALEKPDLVVFSSMWPCDLECLRETKRRKIPLILTITSWDHPTSKGPLTAIPDGALVWSDEMKEQLLQFHPFEPELIKVVGVLYFERYFQRQGLLSREEFCKTLNISPDKKIIHYATGDSSIIKCNQEFIRILQRIVRSGKLVQPCHLLVRVSPKDIFSLYKEFEGTPDTTIQYPLGEGSLYGSNKWLPAADEDSNRASTILNSDVILSVSSSMVLDAICFDLPVINLAYDADLPVLPKHSVEHFYRFTHAQTVLEEKATWLVKNERELIDALNEALKHPEKKKTERSNLFRRIIQFSDGNTAQRWKAALLSFHHPKKGECLENS